jgi:23S rRNA pseudouridine1911/1915/1917 synthase
MLSLYTPPPSEQIYRSGVPSRYIGFPIEKYFASRFPYLSEKDWVTHIQNGRITVNDQPVEPGFVLGQCDLIITRMEKRTEPPANRNLEIIYEDKTIRAFNKAAPIPVHPSGRYFYNSMTELLKQVYPEETPRPVQRLDALTTGVIVFARNRKSAEMLMHEFQNNRVEKEYLALVDGRPKKTRFVLDAPIGKIVGSRRSTGPEAVMPKQAITKVEWLTSIGEQSLLRIIPRSGRTNQIRVHLADAGLPILNDPVYGPDKQVNLGLGLHASRLQFQMHDNSFELQAAPPEFFNPFLDALK